MVSELKTRGHRKMSRSALIRFALDHVESLWPPAQLLTNRTHARAARPDCAREEPSALPPRTSKERRAQWSCSWARVEPGRVWDGVRIGPGRSRARSPPAGPARRDRRARGRRRRRRRRAPRPPLPPCARTTATGATTSSSVTTSTRAAERRRRDDGGSDYTLGDDARGTWLRVGAGPARVAEPSWSAEARARAAVLGLRFLEPRARDEAVVVDSWAGAWEYAFRAPGAATITLVVDDRTHTPRSYDNLDAFGRLNVCERLRWSEREGRAVLASARCSAIDGEGHRSFESRLSLVSHGAQSRGRAALEPRAATPAHTAARARRDGADAVSRRSDAGRRRVAGRGARRAAPARHGRLVDDPSTRT